MDHEERRSVSREGILKDARIIFGNENTEVACEVRDITKTGARLKCAVAHEWPDKVSASIDGAQPVECQVIWSLNTLLGVKFIDGEE